MTTNQVQLTIEPVSDVPETAAVCHFDEIEPPLQEAVASANQQNKSTVTVDAPRAARDEDCAVDSPSEDGATTMAHGNYYHTSVSSVGCRNRTGNPPMSGKSRDETSGIDGDRPAAGGRIAALETAETYTIYDRDDHRAWLESDLALAVDAMR